MRRHALLTVHACALLVGLGVSPGCRAKATTATPEPRWHVGNGFLRDPDGRAVILRGVNLAGAHKNPPYFGFQQPPDYARVHDAWGMNAVRFLVTWAAIAPRAGEIDAAYLDQVAMRIGWARDAGLFVVLDMHQDVYGEGFVAGGGDGAPRWTCDEASYASFKPLTPWFLNSLSGEVSGCFDHFWHTPDLARDYTEAWRRLAARLVSFDNVIGFDVMNEPYWGSTPILDFEPTFLQPFYEQVVKDVREVSPNLVAFLEPSAIRNIGGATRLVPFSVPDVVYAPHSYDRDAESGNGFDATHASALIANVHGLADDAKSLGAALWIGEYGGQAEAKGIVEYMTAQYDAAGQVAAGAMYWAYDKSDGYGLLAPDGAEKTNLVDVVVRPYPERIAGEPVSYAFDAATRTFTFTYRPDSSVRAPTVLSLPDRVFPKGYVVDCGGCASTKEAGRLILTSPPPGDVAVVTVHP
jgi:endoglycosylceramidase